VSFQVKPRYGNMVVCDICGDFGVIGDWDWRKMGVDGQGRPIHLCKRCRPAAAWCAIHQQYHLRTSLHRRPCVACGGLFTSAFNQRIEHCPQCRRALPAPTQPRRPSVAGALQQLFSTSWLRLR
jgi:hypothetical protein